MSVDQAALAQLARFDDQYQPAERNVQYPGLEALTDNQEYDFTIQDAELTVTPKTKDVIFRLILRVDKGPLAHMGLVVQSTYFFDKAERTGYLGADLITLGFDADTWKKEHGKAFSTELANAIPRMNGIRFAAKKVSKEGNEGKTFHNIYINRRLGAASLPSSPPSANGPAKTPVPATTGPGPTDDNDIPF
jgi:hypothetical protein